MKKLILIIPIMVIVYFFGLRILTNNYPEISSQTQFFIALGGAIFSGFISIFLFRKEEIK
ncbi:hypothetical protein JOC85_000915 [Bacillus mesophilus]|uniref:Histidine kinase n=1 Tax=Bacillus mesophilus TaxID=1808955 RepID=A0A6M0QBN1_9BACI|nr:histidine kinase [Bacillus mesophilus]MBM7660148.1 hypothetical protein [Bacillus mesophilus]NEY73801.1 histidine kinase [Bacillus mesophilus]